MIPMPHPLDLSMTPKTSSWVRAALSKHDQVISCRRVSILYTNTQVARASQMNANVGRIPTLDLEAARLGHAQ